MSFTIRDNVTFYQRDRPVQKSLYQPVQSAMIKGTGQDDYVRLSQPGQDLLHVVVLGALSRGLEPAGPASGTGFDVHPVGVKLMYFRAFPHAFQKQTEHLVREGLGPWRAGNRHNIDNKLYIK